MWHLIYVHNATIGSSIKLLTLAPFVLEKRIAPTLFQGNKAHVQVSGSGLKQHRKEFTLSSLLKRQLIEQLGPHLQP